MTNRHAQSLSTSGTCVTILVVNGLRLCNRRWVARTSSWVTRYVVRNKSFVICRVHRQLSPSTPQEQQQQQQLQHKHQCMALNGWRESRQSNSDSHEPGIVQLLAQAAASGRTGTATRKFLRHRICSLSLSRNAAVDTSQVGGIRWLVLDHVEQRYLLTAATDSTVEAFDVLAASAGGGQHPVQLSPLFTVKRSHPAAHSYQVTSVCWYPVDTGLFITGSADHDVKVWDTNMLQVACAFRCPDKVICTAMPSCGSHALIAVGTKKPGVLLADVASGAFTHTLTGHANGTWAVCWSPSNEHQLLSGDASGEVRLWDIRRSGTRALLDMAVTQRPKPAAGSAPAAVAGRATASRGSGVKRKSASAAAAAGGGSAEECMYDDPRFGVGVRHRGRATKPTAHEGPVTGIHATADGLSLLTAGADNRLRLWDACHLHHRLLHYSDTFNRGAFPKRMCSTPDGRHLFYPRGDDIQVFDVESGEQLALLSQGHYDTVTACAYSPHTQQLFSAATDGVVLIWEPWTPPDDADGAAAAAAGGAAGQLDRDQWLVAASGRQQQQQQQQQVGPGVGAARAASRPTAADIDAWSEDGSVP